MHLTAEARRRTTISLHSQSHVQYTFMTLTPDACEFLIGARVDTHLTAHTGTQRNFSVHVYLPTIHSSDGVTRPSDRRAGAGKKPVSFYSGVRVFFFFIETQSAASHDESLTNAHSACARVLFRERCGRKFACTHTRRNMIREQPRGRKTSRKRSIWDLIE